MNGVEIARLYVDDGSDEYQAEIKKVTKTSWKKEENFMWKENRQQITTPTIERATSCFVVFII